MNDTKPLEPHVIVMPMGEQKYDFKLEPTKEGLLFEEFHTIPWEWILRAMKEVDERTSFIPPSHVCVREVECFRPWPEEPELSDLPSVISIGLSDIRAADNIFVSYDFARDGWIIQQEEIASCDGQYASTGKTHEVAFVASWGLERQIPEGIMDPMQPFSQPPEVREKIVEAYAEAQ